MPDVERLHELDAQLASLRSSPAWAALREEMKREKTEYTNKLGRLVHAGHINEKEIWEKHGFWAGVFHVLDTPKLNHSKLGAELDKED